MARKPFPLLLSEGERAVLRRLAKKRKVSMGEVLRGLLIDAEKTTSAGGER